MNPILKISERCRGGDKHNRTFRRYMGAGVMAGFRKDCRQQNRELEIYDFTAFEYRFTLNGTSRQRKQTPQVLQRKQRNSAVGM